jgi:hypothetical protein
MCSMNSNRGSPRDCIDGDTRRAGEAPTPPSVWQHYTMIARRVECRRVLSIRLGQHGPKSPLIAYAQGKMACEAMVDQGPPLWAAP